MHSTSSVLVTKSTVSWTQDGLAFKLQNRYIDQEIKEQIEQWLLNLCWLMIIGYYATQYNGDDYNPIEGSLQTNQYTGMREGFSTNRKGNRSVNSEVKPQVDRNSN